MKLLSRFNALLHLLAALSLSAFLVANDQGIFAIPVVATVIITWLLSRGDRSAAPFALPRLAINIMVLAAIAHAALRAASPTNNDPIVSILGQFLVLITLVKLFDRRSARDDAQVVTLCLFVVIASVLTSNAFVVAALLFLIVPTALATAMLWQIRAGVSATFIAVPQRPSRRTTGRFGLGFGATLLITTIGAFVVAGVIFVFLPRGIGGDAFGRFGVVQETRVGFREAVQLGKAGLLSDDPTPVMDVRVTTDDGEPLGSAQQPLYLRGGARDEYNAAERVWQESDRRDQDRPARQQRRSGQRVSVISQRHYQELVRSNTEWFVPWDELPRAVSEPNALIPIRVQHIVIRGEPANGVFFGQWRPISLTFDRDMTVNFATDHGTIRRAGGNASRLEYTIKSAIGEDHSPPDSPTLGFQQGRIRDYTLGILTARDVPTSGPDVSPRQVAMTIRDHLQRNFQYTTEMIAPPEGVDPIEFFLFDRKQGHCEYFASAMTAMCQSIGLPARVATGYVTSEFSMMSSQYLVRQSNAHAWVEVFITTSFENARGRWETFDPSPPADIERIHRPPAGLLASLRSWYETLEFSWASSVIGFDSTAQRRLFGRASSPGSDIEASEVNQAAERLASWLRSLRNDSNQLPWFIRLSPAIVIALLASALVLRHVLSRFLNSRKTRVHAHTRPSGPLGPAYSRALKMLSAAGLAKPPTTPPLHHADAIAPSSDDASRSFRDVVRAYYQSRFAGQIQTHEHSSVNDKLAELKSALNRLNARR